MLAALHGCLFYLVHTLRHIGSIQQERTRRPQDGLGTLGGLLPRSGAREELGT